MSNFGELLEPPPVVAEARASTDKRGLDICGACRRRLQHPKQWRCPWVSCRKWLRGTSDVDEELAT